MPPKQIQSSSLFDGINNPSGLMLAAAGPVFLAFIPLTNYLTHPNSVVQKALETLIAIIPGTENIQANKMIPALSAFYVFWTFAATGAASAASLGASQREGLDNNHPRKHIAAMTGFPLRLKSAHLNTVEMFPGFALAAALAYTTSPQSQVLINLLGLHVLAKVAVYYPAYLLDVAPVRSLAHFVATASVINVCWLVAVGK